MPSQHDLMADIFNESDSLASGRREDAIVKAPFNYASGKWRSRDQICEHLPYRNVYCEPFGGTGIILLTRHKSKLEIFNDRHAGITALYRCLKDSRKLQALLEWLELTIHSREEFIECKNTWKDCTDDVERAGRWYYSCVYSFGGIGRNFGRSIKPNAILAGKIRDKLPLFPLIHERIRDVQIENRDVFDLIDDYDQYDMVWYMDPPYAEGDLNVFGTALRFDHDKHRELLHRIKHMRGFVAISGRPNPLYDEQNFWDNRRQWTVQGSIDALDFNGNNHAEGVGKREQNEEVLWIKEAK